MWREAPVSEVCSHKGHLTSKLSSKAVLVLPSLIFPFHLLASPVLPTGFSFYIFSGFLAMFILFSFNNNNIISAYI